MKNIFILLFFLMLMSVLISGCEKTNVTSDDLIGEWIDESKADTIRFIDDANFYRSTKNMHYDHYDYSIKGDSITIRYNGMLKIYVQSTTHYFKLKGNELMIDLTNSMCYGFPEEKMYYKKVREFIPE